MKDDDLTLHFTAMDWKPGPPPEQKEPRKRRKVPEELLNLDITDFFEESDRVV